jgi:hypothetical protein
VPIRNCRAVELKGTLLIGLVGLWGCTAGPPDEKRTDPQPGPTATGPAQKQAPALPARPETASRLPAAEPAPPPEGVRAGANKGPCLTLSPEEARAATGLRLAGSVGPYRFFAEQRALLCSEPGMGGIGECEIVKPTIIRVKSSAATYGLKSRAGVPALLIYGPKGISCVAPR